ncbi:MAG: MoaD/ThiS family protein [Desulfitobacteriaceae bacterium]|nr:MoaD/ThiS family protein [Desulfitobacteriaceae bacterium]MDI6877869.1 MoaD/ThiS family protein [Desulfitobacteriaceae bacterium]MDI6912730.1 MoaD/ThiS family protein [Desulfitobacteriaceae bacterium]
MKITIKLFASLRRGRFKSEQWDVPEGSTVELVFDRLGLQPRDVSILRVNGRDVADGQVLRAGDIVTLFPPLGGG